MNASSHGESGPSVSVLIPSYNYATKIARCIESVLAQSHSDFEMVISDDASTDGSSEVIRRYNDPRIRFEQQLKNLGMVPNWHRCAELARGRYLLLLGADDYLHPTMLAECVKQLDADPDIALCHTAAEFFTDDGRIVATTGALRRSYVRAGVDLIEEFLQGRRMVSSSTVFRRDRWEELGGWSKDFLNCMDADLWFRMILRWKVAYVGRVLIGFCSHGVADRWKLMQADEDLRFIDSMIDRLPSTHTHLKALRPRLREVVQTRWYFALRQLPPSDERDRALARLQPRSPTTRRGGRILALKSVLRERATVVLAQLPDELRYRIGEYLGMA